MASYVLTVSCKSTRGIVAAITGYLAEKGCNIVDSSQSDDRGPGLFFMRLSFASEARGVGKGLRRGHQAVQDERTVPRRQAPHEGAADGVPLRPLPERSALPLEDRRATDRHCRRRRRPGMIVGGRSAALIPARRRTGLHDGRRRCWRNMHPSPAQR